MKLVSLQTISNIYGIISLTGLKIPQVIHLIITCFLQKWKTIIHHNHNHTGQTAYADEPRGQSTPQKELNNI